MPEFLVFQLYGPLASWGDIAVGEARPTADHPSKSAVLGLLGASIGVQRNDSDAHRMLRADLGYAVRLDLPGALLQDYHTVQIPATRQARSAPTRTDELAHGKVGTLLSTRGYRTDALATVCLWLRSEQPRWSLSNLKHALERPRFTPYLGRKACPPALHFVPKLLTASTLREAFSAYDSAVPLEGRADLVGDATPARLFTEVDGPPHGYDQMRDQTLRTRRDVSMDRVKWLFVEREEIQITFPQTG